MVYFEVTEPKLRLRLRLRGPLVRILGMIDRLQPNVNLMNNIVGRIQPIFLGKNVLQIMVYKSK